MRKKVGKGGDLGEGCFRYVGGKSFKNKWLLGFSVFRSFCDISILV